jgi:transcriptional regulator of acetoin/glycerol metabolism
VVRDSWDRAIRQQVAPGMPEAPIVWDADHVGLAREHSDWLPYARHAVASSSAPYADGGHILSLFDARGRMLWSDGDPRALDGLAEINFRPGALWAEEAVGTNGPGTALATGGPVHIVGAEHFCERWQEWHCAAMPVRDPLTGEICGVVDISGFRDSAHPHTLSLTATLVVAIEQMLRAREAERRTLVMRRLAELTGQWPGDTALAVDRAGTVIGAVHEEMLTEHGVSAAATARQVFRATQLTSHGGSAELMVPMEQGLGAIVHPVVVNGVTIGAGVIIPRARPVQRGASALVAAVRECRTMDEAAKRLGVTRSTLYRRMAAAGLRPGKELRARG